MSAVWPADSEPASRVPQKKRAAGPAQTPARTRPRTPLATAHGPSSFSPRPRGKPWTAVSVLPLSLLCFLCLRYSDDPGPFQGILLCQRRGSQGGIWPLFGIPRGVRVSDREGRGFEGVRGCCGTSSGAWASVLPTPRSWRAVSAAGCACLWPAPGLVREECVSCPQSLLSVGFQYPPTWGGGPGAPLVSAGAGGGVDSVRGAGSCDADCPAGTGPRSHHCHIAGVWGQGRRPGSEKPSAPPREQRL